jgi:MoaA/NifB/PqqE/SkfB family radical SAM enzyme
MEAAINLETMATTGLTAETRTPRRKRCYFAAPRWWSKFVKPNITPTSRDTTDANHTLQQRHWRLLQVESAIACNLRCVMCPWAEIRSKTADQGVMSSKIWGAIRPYLLDVVSIDFTGGGEPLLQPRLAEWLAEANTAGCETGFLSNGLLLEESRLKSLLDSGVDWICISMDGATAEMYHQIRIGADFERVCRNVARIADLRSGKKPKTMINFVIMKMNVHQAEEIIRLAARLRVDQVNFKQCDVIRGEHGKGLGLFGAQETREIRRRTKAVNKARRLAKKLSVQTTAFAFTPHELPVCEQDPRNSIFIRYDGAVAPCINLAIGGPTTFLAKEVMMPTVHYGRLPQDDLMDLWQSDTSKFYRRQFEQRALKYDETIVRGLMGPSGSSRLKALQEAQNAMPNPPEGCNVCHYLYDI